MRNAELTSAQTPVVRPTVMFTVEYTVDVMRRRLNQLRTATFDALNMNCADALLTQVPISVRVGWGVVPDEQRTSTPWLPAVVSVMWPLPSLRKSAVIVPPLLKA